MWTSDSGILTKKADLKSGKISNDEYIEWTINYPTEK